MGREYIHRDELPLDLACPQCGNKRKKVEGYRTMAYEETVSERGLTEDCEYTDVEKGHITCVTCADCGTELSGEVGL